jgi:hypothetical protein
MPLGVLTGPTLLILVAWVAIALVLVGVGSLVRQALRAPVGDAADWLLAFWLGWVATLFVLGLWHLALPVDRRALIVIVALGLAGHGVAGLGPWRALARGARRHAALLVVLALAAVWLADRAVFRVMNGDSGLYHVPTIRWLTAYAVVPGLGNLHERYAFNQSYFLYAALLDVAPFAGRTAHIANGILLLAAVARGLLGAHRLLGRGRRWSPADLCAALFLPALAPAAFDVNLSNPTPDLALYAFAFVLAAELVEVATPGRPAPARDFAVAALAILCLGAVTVKLSAAMLAGATLVVGVALWLWRERPEGRRRAALAATLAVAGLGGVGPWLAHGVVLSGYPLFPVPVLGLPVEWRLSRAAVDELNRPILLWDAVGLRWWQALRNPAWLATALESNGWGARDAVLLGVASAAAACLLLHRLLRRGAPARVSALVLVPPLASLLYVFATAPLARYAGASLALLAALAVGLLVADLAPHARRALPVVAGGAALVLAGVPFARGDAWPRTQARFDPVSPPRYATLRLATGLEVLHPENMMCWDAPLPCTPTPNPRLRLRRAHDLASGFVVEPASP